MSLERQLWYTRCPLPTASGIALDAGILQRRLEGIGWSVDTIEAAGDAQARASHFTHGTARLFRQGGNIPPIWARARGAGTALVGIAWTPEYQAILARPETGIRTVGDLRRRRLGLPVRTSGEIDFWRAMCLRGYDSALRLAGASLDDVELIELPVRERYIPEGADDEDESGWMWAGGARMRRQQAEVFAFIRGEVDAIYTSGAQGLQLRALLGATEVVDLGSHPGPDIGINNQVPNILTVDATLAREHPEVVAEYLRALREAAGWAQQHEADANRTCAREVGAPEEWIAPAYRNGPSHALAVGLDDRLIAAVASQKDFLLRHGFITQDFELAQWIDPRPLELSSRMETSS
ncbi:ABC transporter substrate-binding protein [Verticiella sediminum]|uniref:ABC transporter substrate-binding protein n=1 Tax=Verticiella sediminum TaxID=1247510 RepID=A0A556ALT0_9BURK|nr:ABC transporter substrate-binding protein [Verticiella sediminum]TSH93854.1 ABC transporter substrate-binding protein [Verticiella sediminum]